MTCERRLCVAILARIPDTCQESVPLCCDEGADFVFFILIHNDDIVYLLMRLLSVTTRGWRAHGQIFLTIAATIAEIIV